MRKVKNQQVIRNLADKSFRANKMRNRIAILAIALTTMLFTTIFTIGIGTMESFQRNAMRQSGGDSHGVIKDLTKEQYEKMKDHPSIKESAPCMLMADRVCNPEFLKRHVEMWYYPEYYYKHCFVEIIDGRAPEKADELLVDETTMQLLGLPAKAGEKVTLTLQIKQSHPETVERTFTVSGVSKADPAFNVGMALVSEAYTKEYAAELIYTYNEDYSKTGTIRMDVNFSNSLGIQKKLDRIITDSGYSATEGEADYIASNANWAYLSDGTENDPMTMAALAAGFALILLAGYLIIYNIFQISVIRDIRYYGLLKTVGTTGRQVKRIIRRQALRMACMGIPFGLLLGFLAGKWLVPFVIARSAYRYSEAVVSVNPLIFIGAAVFSLFTVFISTRKPEKIAAKVSPVEAVRFTEGDTRLSKKGGKKTNAKGKQKKTTDGGKVPRMAFSNLARSKGRTAVVILSLSLAIILLNSLFTVTASFDMNTFLKKFVTTDYQIANAKYFGMDYYRGMSEEEVETENLTESFISACEEQEGFEEGGRVYGTARLGLEAISWNAPEYVPHDDEGYYDTYGGEKIYLYSDEQGAYSNDTLLYGLEEFPLKQIDVYEGEKDLETIQEKLASGNYLIYSVSTDDNGNVRKEDLYHRAGDQVTLVQPDGTKREFEILTVIKENYYGLTNRLSYRFCYYTTADVFKEMESDQFLMEYMFNVKDDQEAEFTQFVENYTTTQEPLMGYESKQKWVDEFSGIKNLFVLVGGVLSAVIGLIGILNFINSVLTSIITRRKEFAMMEAIGMTKKQLVRMLVLEGIYYAGITMASVLVVGSLFSLTVVRALSGGMWFMKYHFVILPILLICPVLLALGILVPYLAYKPQKKHTLVEEIRRND